MHAEGSIPYRPILIGFGIPYVRYDLLYEWLVEIRPRVLLSEYGTIWGTFVAIQIVGVDFGIVLGVLVAILDNVVSTAQTTTVRRVQKRSRAVWTPSEYKVLHDHGYHVRSPKIVVLDIAGPVFFGSSLGLLDRMIDEVGLSAGTDDSFSLIRSPHTSSFLLMSDKRPSIMRSPGKPLALHRPPQFVVIDLSLVSNMDASAARTCFLQFSTMCSKRGIVVCAACATPRMDWVFRSHSVTYSIEKEEEMKSRILTLSGSSRRHEPKYDCEKVFDVLNNPRSLGVL